MMHNYEFKFCVAADTRRPARQEPVPLPATTVPAATPPKGGPLTPRALYQDVAERLRQQIFNRQLEPGAWIDELKIAAEYGISRTPLREALKVLAVEGLVTMKVRRGAYVTEMSTT
jgi:DNA-binding GntR family transcriptional regulator